MQTRSLLLPLCLILTSCALPSAVELRGLADRFDDFRAETEASNEDLADAFAEAAEELEEAAEKREALDSAVEALGDGLETLGSGSLTTADGATGLGGLGVLLWLMRLVHRGRRLPPDLAPPGTADDV